MKRIYILLVIVLFALTSCTENQRARNWGGTSTVELKEGQQLVNATWKGQDLWLLTEKREDSVAPSSYTFEEQSSYGVMEGTIIIKEQ